MNPHLRPKCLITLINRDSTSIYSAMVSGVIAGEYQLDEVQINLRQLANRAGVAFVLAEINGLDPLTKNLHLYGRPSIQFTSISLDVGSEINLKQVNPRLLKKDSVVPIKPFNKALEWIQIQDRESDLMQAPPVSVIGSGLAALEIVFALRKRWPKRCLQLKIFLNKTNKQIRESLSAADIEVIKNENLITGPTLLCTGSDSPRWLSEAGLPTNSLGRILTRNTFQSIQQNYIFAAGDCAVIEQHARPASGVWAVRAADPLAKNLERFISGSDLVSWFPQRSALQLMGGPFKSNVSLGWAFWKGINIGPFGFLWNLKRSIDTRFITMFETLFSMRDERNTVDFNQMCRGCAAKLQASSLRQSLSKAGLGSLISQPEDAPVVAALSQGETLIQSVDGFPALISDVWLNARLTTLHACSDIWATGGVVISAQPLITLPSISAEIQEELLVQILGGIKSVLEPQGAQLIGGHTMESRSAPQEFIPLGVDIGITVNGLVADGDKCWKKNGLQSGDIILLSREIGSGVLFAAAMKGNVSSINLDLALSKMNTSQHSLIQDLLKFQDEKVDINAFHACTDITGFGLLGHLSEILQSSNSLRLLNGLPSLRIKLEPERIPVYQGVLDLFAKGYASTSAPANRKFWNLFNSTADSPALFEFSGRGNLYQQEEQKFMELIVDPQTCGPLAIACSEEMGNILISKGPWSRIGLVETI